MEPQKRGRGKRPPKSPTPGTFKPARPGDTQDVVTLFAIAARAACAKPAGLAAISRALSQVCETLVSPEANAAQECAHMWQLFARVAQLLKDTLRLEAGRAFCRDLDALAQRLELPPLAEWLDLPEGVADPAFKKAAADDSGVTEATRQIGSETSIEDLASRAKTLSAAHPGKRGPPPEDAAELLAAMDAGARATWLDAMVGKGTLSRGDVSLLIRYLAKGGTIGTNDTMLIEVLARLVKALAAGGP